ncbi:Hypothetical protein FKW44_006347 [Caligus rogercresseyi]|uniref:Uncharacterized protein n=1 Tax=Caligus rogercresseyi TaxID=217165 RepID=A0A7T8KDA6_CALRO|nr:Hypothetical protein FKW44_006347 [Caligus rogercresseyi]
MAFEGFLIRIFTSGEGFETPTPIVVAGRTQDPRCIKWHLRGSLLEFLQVAKRLKPQYPLFRLAEPEGPRCTKWHLRGSLLVFLQVVKV